MAHHCTVDVRFPLAFAFAFVASLLWHGQAQAHSWYPFGCCADKDCERLPIDAVIETAAGWAVSFYSVKQHFLIRGVVPFGKTRDSQDGGFHVCANPTRIICLFVPRNS